MHVTVIGGGLAGAEAAWQAAQCGVPVTLYEMRPQRATPAHTTDLLAELVCSNSLGSDLPDRASGLLKAELRRLGSLILAAADETALPAGGALAVGREAFSRAVTSRIETHPLITIRREEVTAIPDGWHPSTHPDGIVIVATGPLTSDALAADIARLVGAEQLYFYDAMAPIVTLKSINMSKAFRASRYGRGDDEGGDYINCPLTEQEYSVFVEALLKAECNPLRTFERDDQHFFEACLPVEVIAARGQRALAFGPLKPVGLSDPHTGQRPYAVVQLRQDDLAATLYNMVGFQTHLRWGEQERVFRLIPGLEQAEFVRLGQMHRNTFIHSPSSLSPTMAFKGRESLFFAGQLTGTEGYVGSTASGYVAGVNAARLAQGKELLTFPPTTMIGALCRYVTTPQKNFQPMKAAMGLLPPLAPWVRGKRERFRQLAKRAMSDLELFIRGTFVPAPGE